MIRCRRGAAMRFDSVKKLKGEAFRRLTGVQRSTFEDMVGLLFAAKRRQKAAGGKPNTLCIEDQLLMMLEYWREYRTYFHIAQTHGISESAAYRNIKWCENTLARSKTFRLPGRKVFFASRRRLAICSRDWSSDVCSSDLPLQLHRNDAEVGPPPPRQKNGLGRQNAQRRRRLDPDTRHAGAGKEDLSSTVD